ncbi:MAG: helix-turn-helix domain-containing protein [Clostridiales bacterium]|nr:helix-turn-helix domain-containing protein [Clostridiales bacterium]
MNANHNSEFSVGEKIKAIRLSRNLTQESLSHKAGITTKYLSLLETDQREASIHVYRCIAAALHIPMWWLFCDLSEEIFLVLTDFDDCSEMEIRALRRFITRNKHALRQHHNLDY